MCWGSTRRFGQNCNLQPLSLKPFENWFTVSGSKIDLKKLTKKTPQFSIKFLQGKFCKRFEHILRKTLGVLAKIIKRERDTSNKRTSTIIPKGVTTLKDFSIIIIDIFVRFNSGFRLIIRGVRSLNTPQGHELEVMVIIFVVSDN